METEWRLGVTLDKPRAGDSEGRRLSLDTERRLRGEGDLLLYFTSLDGDLWRRVSLDLDLDLDLDLRLRRLEYGE